MTTRYRLDDLGWYQFEQLIQSALKADLGIGIESWGDRRDHGRDAYCEGALNFPAKHLSEDGPFIFQAKFVENANSAGAQFDTLVLNAISKEIAQIKQRQVQRKWKKPRHYAFITNAPLSASLRKELESTFKKAISRVNFHSLSGNDICAILDNHPTLRRSFPQLLSLRDLDELLAQAVSRDVLEKSRSAIELARDTVPVFVPTSPYDEAWKVLREHHFVVLEGPPEMGKTSIAWMIALAQISQGWQAIVCDAPMEVFETIDASASQIFIADDAFGRTEYDPARGSKWETQLERILRRLDKNHWLVWTSRKHILERACRQLDLQGLAETFPKPGAVLVNASKLVKREKALILYRHARAAGLEEAARALIRLHAPQMVNDPSFTPERIRRMVKDRLPDLAKRLATGELDPNQVSSELEDAIRNPTDRMRKAFERLDDSYKWLLLSLLEAGSSPRLEEVRTLYLSHCPKDKQRPFEELIDELSEAFIKTFEYQW